MNKQLLSFVSFVALAVTPPPVRLVAAPADAPGSVAESDRRFLNNLENNEAAKPAPAPSQPAAVASTPRQPQVMPTPVEPAAPAPRAASAEPVAPVESAAAAQPVAPPVQHRPQSTANQTVINGKWSEPEMTDAPNPRPARSAARVTAAAPRKETQARTVTTVPTRRAVTAVDEETNDAPVASGPGVSGRIYKSRSVDGAVTVAPKSPARKTREVAPDEEGTHIVQPAEVAQYGVAPTVPTKTTKVTTTYVQQPVPAPQQADGNEGRDEDRNQEKRFFHRLFNGGLFKKHVDDHD